jgi:hypothetical protein
MHSQSTLPLCRCGCGRQVTRPGYTIIPGAHLRKLPAIPYLERFWPHVDKGDSPTACWLWTGGKSSSGAYGYGSITINGKPHRCHRVAYEIASGHPIPEGFDVLHICDVPLCVRNDDEGTYEVGGLILPRWGHVALGTQALNNHDMTQKGRRIHIPASPETRARGERSGRAKLTEADVREIRRLRASNSGHMHTTGRWTLQRLAERFGMSDHQIHMICTLQSWQNVQ